MEPGTLVGLALLGVVVWVLIRTSRAQNRGSELIQQANSLNNHSERVLLRSDAVLDRQEKILERQERLMDRMEKLHETSRQ